MDVLVVTVSARAAEGDGAGAASAEGFGTGAAAGFWPARVLSEKRRRLRFVRPRRPQRSPQRALCRSTSMLTFAIGRHGSPMSTSSPERMSIGRFFSIG